MNGSILAPLLNLSKRTVLPAIPEPDLTPQERAELSAAMRDPEFWEWFEKQPEPLDPHRPTRSEHSLEGTAVNGPIPVGQEGLSE